MRPARPGAGGDAPHTLLHLLKLLAARTPGPLNLADVGRDARLPHTTLPRYLALLETVFLVHRLPAWPRNLGQCLAKAPKLHLVDIWASRSCLSATSSGSSQRRCYGRLEGGGNHRRN
jgi:predicted AAA+ superfamily ATPase